ncbi:Predicted arabinose efflux permease, MFS family [Amycolatopsis pretoriensis]|uniref:Predicted arabinose efflux permease, MFS family n=1 Tax=Amycolatopsis pretoriensis TaxID=218821 RepID=A0A1H5RFG7_9PSEU|nr:MFS transporter [Amycolatopsis pretoriensis]SEF37065.1 Predicted arabinose efflux permease, MFS family [Amycolatopsis pretoriensis]
MASTLDSAPRRRSVLWTAEHRLTTIALLLVVTLVAFENMGVATAMPTLVADLHGLSLYSWPFTIFLISSVVATVLSGRIGDRRGPAPALLAGPVLFAAGLVVAGTATAMPTFLLGRALQGFGSGLLLVSVSLLIALTFTDQERPVIYAANAAAWVLPAVIGPSLAGVLTVSVGWRWVFLGLVPLVVIGVVMLVVVVRRLPTHAPSTGGRRAGVVQAIIAALGVAALTWAVQHQSLLALAYGTAGLVALGYALRTLLPTGTLTSRPGLPTVVASRALIAGAYAGMEAYLPLTMTAVHGYSPALAGLPLTITALGWSAASAAQGRFLNWSREASLRTGFWLVAAGLVVFGLVSQPWFPAWPAFVACAVGGAGMGIAMPAISVLLLRYSPAGERGFNTSAMQLADWVGSALLIGLGGVLLSVVGSVLAPSPAMALLTVALVALALLGARLTGRWPSKV